MIWPILCTVIWSVTAELHNYDGKSDNLITINEISEDREVKELIAETKQRTESGNDDKTGLNDKKYKPDWSDLDARPLPEWYDRAKVGIMLHWGVYSVPAYISEWFWEYWILEGNKRIEEFMGKNYPPGFTYQQFAPMFTAESFYPEVWAKLFKKAGAKYVVLTTKHHEGFTLFPSKRSFSWNSVDVGPHRDLVGDLSKAVKSAGLEFGVYHSLYEWFNPIYIEDKKAKFETFEYRDHKLIPDMKQIINDYEPSIFWSDGDGQAYDTYWNSTTFLAWLYNDSPVKDRIVVNDRWGIGTACQHGDFYNCEDRYDPGVLQHHKWENAFTLDIYSWGYRRDIWSCDVLTMDQVLNKLVKTISCGGNVLINVGPTKEGTIAPIFQERLLEIGDWLTVNGEAIYDSSPWLHQNDTINADVWYTCKKTTYNARRPTAVPDKADTLTAIYAIFLNWPKESVLNLASITSELNKTVDYIELLGQNGQNLTWSVKDKEVAIQLPDKATVTSNYAWTLKFTKK